MNCALATRPTSALRAPTRKVASRKSVAPRAISEVNLVIGGGKKKTREVGREDWSRIFSALVFFSFLLVSLRSQALVFLLASLFQVTELLLANMERRKGRRARRVDAINDEKRYRRMRVLFFGSRKNSTHFPRLLLFALIEKQYHPPLPAEPFSRSLFLCIGSRYHESNETN